jgi:hypothetical protein
MGYFYPRNSGMKQDPDHAGMIWMITTAPDKIGSLVIAGLFLDGLLSKRRRKTEWMRGIDGRRVIKL